MDISLFTKLFHEELINEQELNNIKLQKEQALICTLGFAGFIIPGHCFSYYCNWYIDI